MYNLVQEFFGFLTAQNETWSKMQILIPAALDAIYSTAITLNRCLFSPVIFMTATKICVFQPRVQVDRTKLLEIQ